MLRTALVVLAASLLVACSAQDLALAALGGNAGIQEKFLQGLKENFTKQGMSAATTDCIVASIKSKMTPADIEGLIKSDAATNDRLGKLGVEAATACMTPPAK